MKLGQGAFNSWRADLLEMGIKEQLYWLFGAALWIAYIILSEDRAGPYSALTGVTGYLAIVLIAKGVFMSMHRRTRRHSGGDKKDP